MIAHGTRRGYQYAKCRCELCRQWMRDAAKVRRDKARAAQPSQWIAPEPVAAHIRTQLDNGWPANAVAKAAGVTNKVIYAALAGKATLWMAVFADMGASLLVVFNGLRLLRR